MRTDLETAVPVVRLAAILQRDRLDIIGRLWRLWSWADTTLQAANPVAKVPLSWIDELCRCPGFGKAMVDCGWLILEDVPNATGTCPGHVPDTDGTCPETVPNLSQQIRFPGFETWMSGVGESASFSTNPEAERKRRWRARRKGESGKAESLEKIAHPSKAADDLFGTPERDCPGQNVPDCPTQRKRKKQKREETPLAPRSGGNVVFDPASGWPWVDLEFNQAIESWIAHRKELRKPIRPQSHKQQIEACRSWGRAKSLEAIRTAIRSGWPGLYEPKANGHQAAKLDPVAAAKETTRRFFDGEFDPIDALIGGPAQ